MEGRYKAGRGSERDENQGSLQSMQPRDTLQHCRVMRWDQDAGRRLQGHWRGGGSVVASHCEGSDSCVSSTQQERTESREAVGHCGQPEDKMRTNTRKHL